jgi:hypothetical protein
MAGMIKPMIATYAIAVLICMGGGGQKFMIKGIYSGRKIKKYR